MQHSAPRASFLDDLVELLSSMRFAISLLTILAIASLIGTVVQQEQPANAYLQQFGQFWDPIFSRLGLYAVYSSSWFIAILAFLVLSTTLCIIRQFTPMVREIRGFREHAREASLRHFAHRASFEPTLPPEERSGAATAYLARTGFRFRVNDHADSTLIAAKKGSLGRIGYFLAHGSIVLICLGGLLDSNLLLSVQIHLYGKVPAPGELTIGEIPPSARLEPSRWSFRGNIYIPEGTTASQAVINADNGVLLQPLPFKIELKRFHVDHYENGAPKRYASDVVITDNESGEVFERTLEVNKPFEHRGITLYQSGFDNDGSMLNFTAHGMTSCAHAAFPLEGKVGRRIPLFDKQSERIKIPPPCNQVLENYLAGYSLEFTDFRPINVENVGAPDSEGNHPGASFLGSGARPASNEKLRNLGPFYTYILRDPAGQAREFNNYMNPIQIDGLQYLLSGVRTSRMENVSWLRIPLDDEGSADTWFAIQQSFFDPARQAALIKRFISHSTDKDEKKTLEAAAKLLLTQFAQGGMKAVESSISEMKIPEDKREEANIFFVQVLQKLVWDAWMMVREAAGKGKLEPDDAYAPFVRDTFIALDSSIRYGAPFYLQLTNYEQRQATILQATRSPGKSLVYLGSLLLSLGVFAMLFIRERRLFVLFKKDEALVAMSSDRKTIDLDETFARHRDGLAAALGASAPQD
ncbi:MAG: cytochrome c biogenesis protein ResB [Betaproteobacteria bacterium]|nr:cytochrome c biogenesis protein ResB [Betaproteobacteria bacterium]